MADAEPGFGEQRHEPAHRLAARLFDRLGAGDRLHEAEQDRGRLFGDDRIERLGGAAERLIEAEQEVAAEAALERRAGHGDQLADPLEAEPVGVRSSSASSRRSAASGSGAMRVGLAAVRAEDQRLVAEAGQRVGGAGGAGDGDPGGEAEAAAEGEDALAHALLAAEQVGDAAQVQPEPVRAGGRGARASSGGRRTGRGGGARRRRPQDRRRGRRGRRRGCAPW